MAKRLPQAADKVKGAQSVSGATGGPSTGHGMNYQIDYAVYRALDVISRSLGAPHKQWTIRIEPRAVSKEALTRWDLAIDPPEELIEVKLNPTRQDILDWLDRIQQGQVSSPERAFSLVYGKGGGLLLRMLRSLRRTAIEANQDAQKFQVLLEQEDINNAHQILVPLGNRPHTVLQRMTFEQIPEEVLARHIQLQARILTGEHQSKRLLDLLFHKFSEAVPTRTTFVVSDLCRDIERAGIPLQSPPDINPADLCPHAIATLLILQVCPTGLPMAVIAQAICAEPSDLERELTSLVAGGVLAAEDGLWSVKPLLRKLTGPDPADLLCRTLEALLGFIECSQYDKTAPDQLQNAIALARECVGVRPKSVAAVFMTLDKLLKHRGDKHLVLELADLSIGAARRIPRTRREVEGEAQALICGRSWVFQRIGRLTEARIEAEKSRSISSSL